MENEQIVAMTKNLIDVANSLPDQIREQELRIISASIRKETFEIANSAIERMTRKEILFARDDSGKKLYTNEAERQVEIEDKLANSEDYSKNRISIIESNKEIMDAKMEKDYHINRLRCLEIMLSLIHGV